MDYLVELFFSGLTRGSIYALIARPSTAHLCLVKKIRDDKGYGNQIELYIKEHSEAEFSHSICPDCAKKLYGDCMKGDNDQEKT